MAQVKKLQKGKNIPDDKTKKEKSSAPTTESKKVTQQDNNSSTKKGTFSIDGRSIDYNTYQRRLSSIRNTANPDTWKFFDNITKALSDGNNVTLASDNTPIITNQNNEDVTTQYWNMPTHGDSRFARNWAATTRNEIHRMREAMGALRGMPMHDPNINYNNMPPYGTTTQEEPQKTLLSNFNGESFQYNDDNQFLNDSILNQDLLNRLVGLRDFLNSNKQDTYNTSNWDQTKLQ